MEFLTHSTVVVAVALAGQHTQAEIKPGIDVDLAAEHAGYNAVTSRAVVATVLTR